MNHPIVFLPHATRDLNRDKQYPQYGRLKRWLFRVLKRPLIAEKPKAEVFRFKNPTQWKLDRVRRKARGQL